MEQFVNGSFVFPNDQVEEDEINITLNQRFFKKRALLHNHGQGQVQKKESSQNYQDALLILISFYDREYDKAKLQRRTK